MKKTDFVLMLLVVFSGCLNQRHLKRYWLSLLTSADAKVTELQCESSDLSRVGYCLFKTSPSEMEKIVRGLELLKLREISIDKKNLTKLEKTIIWNYNAVPNGGRGCRSLSKFGTSSGDVHKSVEQFIETNKIHPIHPYNSRSSFIRLYYNTQTEDSCVDLEFPYG